MSKGKRIIEWVKTLLIIGLLCLAIWQLADSQVFGPLPWKLEQQRSVLGEQAQTPTGGQVLLPLGVAVVNQNGVCAARYDEAAIDDLVQPLMPLMNKSLGGAAQPEDTDSQHWLAALTRPGTVWMELQGSLPLQVLCGWLTGTENPALEGNVQQLLLCVEQEKVELYFRQDQTYRVSAVSGVDAERLGALLADVIPNGAGFAVDNPGYERLEPQSLILPYTPKPEQYFVENPLEKAVDLDHLLEALAFDPGLTAIYQTPEGHRARNGNDTLAISDAGLVSYEQLGTEPRYPLVGNEEGSNVYRAVETARELVCGLAEYQGGTKFYVRDVRQELDNWRVEFGHVINGIPVHLGAEGWAASVLVSPVGVVQYDIYLREYKPVGEDVLLLPQLQAVAAMEQPAGELLLSYLEGGETLQAGWLTER